MSKEIYISSTPHETRLAVVEDDQLAEIYYERENEYTLAGSIYKGKVTRVLPGMQSAFVDIGLERDAFLYVTDFAEEQEDGEEYVSLPQSQGNGRPESSPAQTQGQNQNPSNGQRRNAEPSRESHAAESGESGSGGGRRWRGRRGRRRGRGGHAHAEHASPAQQEIEATDMHPSNESDDVATASSYEPAYEENDLSPAELESVSPFRAQEPAPTRTSHAANEASPLVLPGESLSKYRRGAPSEPAAPSPAAASPATTKPAAAPSYQPSTMVTGPIEWDGSGLLPGESRGRQKNQPAAAPEPAFNEAPASSLVAEAGIAEPVEAGIVESITTDILPTEVAEPAEAESVGQQEPTPAVEEHPIHEHPLTLHPLQKHPLHTEEEPTGASASYRFDPAAPSAYRQSSVSEPEEETFSQAAIDTPAAEATQSEAFSTFVQEESAAAPEAAAAEIAPEPASPAPEPFFGESVSIAQPAHPYESRAQESSSPAAEAAPYPAFEHVEEFSAAPATESDEETLDETADGESHIFNPGDGHLEEEMIDEEETESYTAHGLLDEEEYDDLVEETLDVQMDSGLLSELVRDKYIDQRTRSNADDAAGNGEEASLYEEVLTDEAALDSEPSPFEFEEVSDEEESDEEDSSSNADAARNSSGQRHGRRGMRGQRSGHGGGDRRRMRRSTAQTSNLPVITELLKPNQEILVQIAKEPIARKGARITSHIALPGRFLVFMPTVNHVGVSRKISSDEERQRLKHILLSEKGNASGGFIVRTAAASASEEDLRADIRFLLTLWADIRSRADSSKPPALIYHDLSLVERVLRDQVTDNFSAIWVDSEQDYERVLRFLNRFEPSLVRRVKLYTKETPLFEQFGIQEEINKALRSKVWLKSGGSIVINQTEALVAIDINTGKYVGKTARLEDTILKTNLDAIPEIVRQIRLRDLGGIIVIDFIDMDERKNRHKVMQALEEELKNDRAPSKVLQFNDFGLVAITRKRVKQSLERTLSVPCSVCTGTGMVKGPVTVCNEIYVELRKMHRDLERGDILLRVHPEVVKQLKAGNGRWLTEMEEMSGKTIIVKSDPALHPEQFDIH